ncbi:CaiB/BaiF CoA transferase family protein [Labrys wisconsinensis]|uniref:CoA:oxalate CoA-transferase n=1 Tax=Labrys wisconsinensis TaxID=425677 RepID=A0ABU0JM05_9HYPH|nr:CoA transferase [Labrys wisconsinensis]MDQ0475326.1 CoA:oxalate CoA-transferase [Labrys wisconsinensis]
MTTTANAASPGALAGLKVLDLSRFIAGPHCGMVLGDLGAEVVKVERARLGDDVRALAPEVNGESLYFLVFNRNKQSLTLDFRNPEAQALLRRLVAEADVLIENFRPGTMERMGLGWDEVHALNPRLIMARISGFGQTGSRSAEPCFDAIAQATSGLMSITGDPAGAPAMTGTFMVDYTTSLYATIGILSALEQRHKSGEGQLVDVSLVGSGVSLMMTAIPEQLLLGRTMNRVGNRDRYSAPAQTFRDRNGEWVYLIAGNDAHFPRLARIMGRLDLLEDERFSTLQARMANTAAIEEIVAEFVARHEAEEIVALMREAEVTCAKIATVADIVADPYMTEAGHIAHVRHPSVGDLPMQASPIRMSETPTAIRRPPPRLGEHSGEVLDRWLALAPGEIETLKARGVV